MCTVCNKFLSVDGWLSHNYVRGIIAQCVTVFLVYLTSYMADEFLAFKSTAVVNVIFVFIV